MLKKLLGACVGLAMLGMAGTANATLIHEFVDSTGAIVGQIEFSEVNDTLGNVVVFSLLGGGQTLSLSNVCQNDAECGSIPSTTVWSIDPAWELNGFFLALGDVAFPISGSDVEFGVQFKDPASTGTEGFGFISGCLAFPTFDSACFSYAGFLAGLQTGAVHIPEPSTLALFATGLAGLGFMG